MARRLALMALILFPLALQAGDRGGPAVGTAAPDFKSRDAATHDKITLSEQTGKVVVLTFWATWCAPCRKELPILEAIQRKLGKDRLVVYAIPFHEAPATYGALVKGARSWQITLIDDRPGWIASRYRIEGIPHLFLIGRDGRIAAEHTGFGDGSLETLIAEVNAALSSESDAPPVPSGQPPAGAP